MKAITAYLKKHNMRETNVWKDVKLYSRTKELKYHGEVVKVIMRYVKNKPHICIRCYIDNYKERRAEFAEYCIPHKEIDESNLSRHQIVVYREKTLKKGLLRKWVLTRRSKGYYNLLQEACDMKFEVVGE